MPDVKSNPEDNLTRASAHRKITNVKRAHDNRRRDISATVCLRHLDHCADEFISIASECKGQELTIGQNNAINAQLKALNSLAALNLRKLSKVLPDLQAIAVVQETPEGPLAALAAACAATPLLESDDQPAPIDVTPDKG